MRPIFGIVFWLILIGLFVGFSVACLFVFVLGWRRKSLLLKLLVGVPFGICLLLAVLFVGLFIVGLYESYSPSKVFENEFGFAPPPEVTELRGNAWVFFDNAGAHLRFKAPPGIVERIVAGKFREARRNDPDLFGSNDPDWWKPSADPSVKIYAAERWGGSFAFNKANLYYDPVTGIVHFKWLGID